MLLQANKKIKSLFKTKIKKYINFKNKIRKLFTIMDKIEIEEVDTHLTIKFNTDKPIGILHKNAVVIGSEKHLILLGSKSIQLNPIINNRDIKTVDGINKNFSLLIKYSDLNLKLNNQHPLPITLNKHECKHKG